MAKKGKPLGNKRQRERDKARKKRDKEARKAAKDGTPIDSEPADRPPRRQTEWHIELSDDRADEKPSGDSSQANEPAGD